MDETDPRLARIARTLAERLRLDASFGHTHLPVRFVPAAEVFPESPPAPHPWQPGGKAAAPATPPAPDEHGPQPESEPPVPETVRTGPETAGTVPDPAPAGNRYEPAPFREPPVGETGGAGKLTQIEPLRSAAWQCARCPLCQTRTHVVFGQGSVDTDLVFVGEAPGRDEDEQGIPFVGRAGQLLTKMIEGGLKRPRESVYICNILKCRPPDNRNPQQDEMVLCMPYLRQQLAIIRPKVICALGRVAATALTGLSESMGRLRGRWHEYEGIPLMPTYHPAYLLRQRGSSGGKTDADRKTWEDLQMIMKRLGKA